MTPQAGNHHFNALWVTLTAHLFQWTWMKLETPPVKHSIIQQHCTEPEPQHLSRHHRFLIFIRSRISLGGFILQEFSDPTTQAQPNQFLKVCWLIIFLVSHACAKACTWTILCFPLSIQGCILRSLLHKTHTLTGLLQSFKTLKLCHCRVHFNWFH